VYFSNDLDVCGLAGTGKTTTIINTLITNGIRFYNINCIMTDI
jgi:Ni2+-binding GTPase involved in maturation of urease and hydrogenase